jgi:RNA 2',3'-cyclic 3'-phosphodiesterase
MLRLFVAAEPPEEVRDDLAHWARGALGRGSPARRLAAESLHLTLAFLGEQPPAAIEAVGDVLSGLLEPFASLDELRVGAPVWLPPRRPRVLAVEIGDPGGALRALHAELTRELSRSLGWEPARERFRPHITLARMRPGSEPARELPPTPAIAFVPTALTLLRSDLDPDGGLYTPLRSIPPR